jgi:hypothetical protein
MSLAAAVIKGKITDSTGTPLPFASIQVKGTATGVATNIHGAYYLELEPGRYTLVFRYVGYVSREKQITVGTKQQVLNVRLQASPLSIDVKVVAERQDLAKLIMQRARDARKSHFTRLRSYRCQTYIKIGLDKQLVRSTRSDSARADTTPGYFDKKKHSITEKISTTSYLAPGRYKDEVNGQRKYIHERYDYLHSVSIGFDHGQEDIIPTQRANPTPYLIYKDIFSSDLNLYKNNIHFESVSQNPIRSPLANSSGLHYKFEFISSFFREGKKLYKLKVVPRNPTDALFKGILYIQDSTWALEAVDLEINRAALKFAHQVRIQLDYAKMDSCYVITQRDISYRIRDGRDMIYGHSQVIHKDYEVNPPLTSADFSNKVKVVSDSADLRDSTYWNANRLVKLDSAEISYVSDADSIRDYYTSDEYYRKQDSLFNRIDPLWVWFTGIGHHWRKRGLTMYLGGIPEQINPFGIGGYRHKLPAYITKEFKNGMLLTNEGFVDYGFNNEDVKGKLSVGWTYIPKRFVRTKLTFGSYYDLINDYASLEQTFSRSNYVHTKTFAIAQRMEITNGLFAEASFQFSDQNPLTGIQLSRWSEDLFGELNEPTAFDRYLKSEVRFELKYRPGQKFIMLPKKKLIIGSDYPELHLIYRKGIPGLFNSEVNFDYIEVGARDQMKIPRWGRTNWSAYMGTFHNRTNLRVLEHKYFRGSDRLIFSNPIQSFQLLGPTMTTRSEYIRGNYIHHFEGTLLGKVPLLNRLRLESAWGAGALLINDRDFIHFEMFAGLERVIRIRSQLMRVGIYAVTANNSLSKADFTIKLGLDFYDAWSKRWSY